MYVSFETQLAVYMYIHQGDVSDYYIMDHA